jgi:hypothetical protein
MKLLIHQLRNNMVIKACIMYSLPYNAGHFKLDSRNFIEQ